MSGSGAVYVFVTRCSGSQQDEQGLLENRLGAMILWPIAWTSGLDFPFRSQEPVGRQGVIFSPSEPRENPESGRRYRI